MQKVTSVAIDVIVVEGYGL